MFFFRHGFVQRWQQHRHALMLLQCKSDRFLFFFRSFVLDLSVWFRPFFWFQPRDSRVTSLPMERATKKKNKLLFWRNLCGRNSNEYRLLRARLFLSWSPVEQLWAEVGKKACERARKQAITTRSLPVAPHFTCIQHHLIEQQIAIAIAKNLYAGKRELDTVHPVHGSFFYGLDRQLLVVFSIPSREKE